MKKLLTVALALAMGATLVGAFAACTTTDKPDDAEVAKKAIVQIRNLYADTDETETATEYTVMGVANVDGELYTVNWTVSSEYDGYANYVSVGEMDATTKKVTVSITKGPEVIAYTLKASITVGEVTETAEFKHTIPQTLTQSDDEIEVFIDFTGTTNRTKFESDQQIWEQNGIKLTNDKGDSITSITQGDSQYHVRLYQTSNVKIEYPGMKSLVFYSDNTYSYHSQLITTLEASKLGTVTSDEEKATGTLVLANAADEIEFIATKQMRLTRIDIVANKSGGVSDETKVAGAKTALDIDQKNYTATGEYELPASKNGATVTWAVTSDYATITAEGKLNVTSMPAEETEVTLTATIKVNDAQDTKNIVIKLIPLAIEHAGTAEDPYTPSEAKQLASVLAPGATGTTEYYVKGYVTGTSTYDSEKAYRGFQNLYVADTNAADQESSSAAVLYVYGMGPDGTILKADSELGQGDLLVVKGKFQNYKPDEDTLIPELVSCTVVAYTKAADLNKGDQDKVDTAKENVAGTLKDTYYKGSTVTLLSTLNGANLVWAVKSGDNVSITDNVMTIGAEATGTVTLTVTISSGSVSDNTTELSFTVEAMKGSTVENALSVAEAKDIAKGLASGGYYSENGTAQLVYVKGYVIATGTYNSSYANYTGVYIVDEYTDGVTANDGIQLYRLTLDTGITAFYKGDLITVYGYIQNYSTGYQVTYNGNTNPKLVAQTLGTSTITVNAGEGATVSEISATKTNGEEVTFTVEVASGKQLVSVKVNSQAITATEGSYKFTVNGNMTVDVETLDDDVKPPKDYELSFADKAKRTSFTNGSLQVWEDNGIKLTNTGSCADYGAPVRIYKNSTVKIECTGMTKILFVCNTAAYATSLGKSIGTPSGATVSVSDKNVTVTFEAACNEFSFTASDGQTRFDSITVTAADNSSTQAASVSNIEALAPVADKKFEL